MRATNMKKAISKTQLLLTPIVVLALLLAATAAFAAAPGVKGTNFAITASPAYISQPDGKMVYSWGYACSGGGTAAPTNISAPNACNNTMQIPGPTLIVTEGQPVTVTLTNSLPVAAGNTSILFPGFTVTATGGVAGLLTQEAAPGGTVTYTFTPTSSDV